MPTCPKCNNSTFRISEVNVLGANYRQNFVCCSSCGCAIGVLGYYDAGVIAKNIEEKVEEEFNGIKRKLNDIEFMLQRIERH